MSQRNIFKITLLTLLFSIGLPSLLWAQLLPTPPDTLKTFTGVSVSPSTMFLAIKPGTTAIREITINNDTKNKLMFQLNTQDFIMSETGKPLTPKDDKYSLSKMIQIIPSYIEMQPGEKTKVKVIINIADTVLFSAWTIIAINQIANERPPLADPTEGQTVAMGVVPSFGFGVYLFQNPPNVINNKIEITKFSLNKQTKQFEFKIKNVGDGIGHSTHYIELTNTRTGKQEKLPVRKFVVLPGATRTFETALPENFENGQYSAVGIIDYGNKENIDAAEIEFIWP